MEILAAYSPIASPSNTMIDKSSVKYNILSGTSMACPHVTAAAAFVKSFHPDWSPSAIKSALMTTGSFIAKLIFFIVSLLFYDYKILNFVKHISFIVV